MRSLGARSFSLVLSLGLLLSGCDGADEDGISARNLSTGEVSTFTDAAEVPPGWLPCPDAACSVPPTLPCQSLGAKVCLLNPECLLDDPCTQVVDSAGGTSPSGCAPICVPRPKPSPCDALTFAKACLTTPGCQWLPAPCPAIACAPGSTCPVCQGGVCQKKTPLTCEQLDLTSCKLRPDCLIASPEACLACVPVSPDDPTDACYCGPRCVTAKPLPPPPVPCPALAPPAPGYCAGGKIVTTTDSNGCTFWSCQMPKECPPEKCPMMGMPNYLCPDGKTIAGPGRCLMTDAGTCMLELVSCPKM